MYILCTMQADAASIVENQQMKDQLGRVQQQASHLQQQVLALTQQRDDLQAQLEVSIVAAAGPGLDPTEGRPSGTVRGQYCRVWTQQQVLALTQQRDDLQAQLEVSIVGHGPSSRSWP